MVKKALITGITGQDAHYLADFLLDKGYEVHGVRLYAATDDTARIAVFEDNPNFHLHYGDLTDGTSLTRLLATIRPDEIYNLGAQSHVQVSFQTPEATADINALGPLRLLESVRALGMADRVRFYQASSSEMFGNAKAPQNEQTPFQPCSPYGVAKLYAYWMVRNYRETYGMHASNGILFNHESPVRGEEFVTRKITRAVAMIAAGQQDVLKIGNMDAARDWGHARDYVEGMWMMLQQNCADDYVLSTGESHTVREFIETAFAYIGRPIKWQGEGLEEIGVNARNGDVLVRVDPQFFRPQELHSLLGDCRKAHKVLGWAPRTSFRQLVAEMVQADMLQVETFADMNSGQLHVLAAE